MSLFKKTILDNGLRIITAPKPDSLATTVFVLVEAGSEYESKEINGVSHFLEHLCFKGTKKRPKPIDITDELNWLGAEYNALTYQERTGYYVKARNEHFKQALDVVSDIYLNSTFDSKEIEKEKGVIIEEINMYEDMPAKKVHELFDELLYGDQPAGWPIAGKKEIIRVLNRDDIVKYHNAHYVAKATAVVVAGGINEEEVIEEIKKKFENISTGEKAGRVKTKESQEKPGLLVKQREGDQVHLVLGVRAFNLFDERRYSLDVMTELLGGGMGSRLFERLRNEMGVVYSVGAYTDLHTHHGFMAAYAGVDPKRVDEAVGAMIGEFQKILDGPIQKRELEKVKNQISGQLVLGLETSDALAGFYGEQEILRKPLFTPEELLAKINSVTEEQIKAVARDVFQNNRLNLAVIGPIKEQKSFEGILNIA